MAHQFQSAVNPEDDLTGLAWRLITQSLAAALFELASEVPFSELEDFDPQSFRTTSGLTGNFEELKGFEITLDFFQYPKTLPLLKPTGALFADWLKEAGVDAATAQNISRRLPPYFVLAMHREWAAFSGDYDKLLKALKSPFYQAAKLELAWARYRAHLLRAPAERLFGVESYGIQDIYISLRAWKREPQPNHPGISPSRAAMDRELRHSPSKQTRIVVDAEDDLLAWIDTRDKDNAIRILSGGPGHGKSTLTLMLAAKIAAKNELPVLRIPLHHLDYNNGFERAINGLAKNDCDLKGFDLSELETPLLLIFDGLDELAMQGDVGARVAKNFTDSVIKFIEKKNSHSFRLMALLTGRTLVTDVLDKSQEKDGQVLHLLDYGVNGHRGEGFNQGIEWKDPDNRLQVDQRTQWWNQYFKLTGSRKRVTPKDLTKGKLDEITRQPLLNYLVSLRSTLKEDKGDKDTNINQVLDDLLRATFDRTWGPKKGKSSQVNPLLDGVKFKDFERFLEEVAVASWYKDGRAAPLADVLPRCKQGPLKRVIEGLEEVSKNGAMRLLTAFYFRRSSQLEVDSQTFEFTHKSFREYLTAKAIVRMGKTMVGECQRNAEDSDVGWNPRLALKKWLAFVGPAFVDKDLLPYVFTEVANQKEGLSPKVSTWGKTLNSLFQYSLERGPDLSDVGGKGFQEALSRVNNAEVALLALIFALAQSEGGGVECFTAPEGKLAPVEVTLNRGRLNLWLHRVGPHEGFKSESVSTQCLVQADLINANLINANLSHANLNHANLILADLSLADLISANLRFANLTGAKLTLANLVNASLSNADLNDADLSGAILVQAKLSFADLSGANLSGADLSGANLSGANLNAANLALANLIRAKLIGAKLSGADLIGAYLIGANFSAANLSSADLSVANLSTADLSGADLSGADLTGADLSNIQYDEETQWPEGFQPPVQSKKIT